MTAPDHRPSGLDSNARGLAVLAVAVVVGLVLLLNAGDGGSPEIVAAEGDDPSVTTIAIDISGMDDPDEEGTTTTPDATTSSSIAETGDTRPPTEVKVLVLNAGGPTGTARSTSDTIGETGYVMQSPANAAGSDIPTTVVYFADSYEADAEAVAAVLGKTPDSVEAMPSTTLGPGADNANVVVVLGADTPPASSGDSDSGSSDTSADN